MLPHRFFDENQVHAFAISSIKDYDQALARYEQFLPYVNNWATCNQLLVSILAKRPEETFERVESWLGSGACYTIRFGIGVSMRFFLEDRFELLFLSLVANVCMPGALDVSPSMSKQYYVDMIRAWYFAEAPVKRESEALPYFMKDGEVSLDEWTRRTAIQKAIESKRVDDDMKELLRSLR